MFKWLFYRYVKRLLQREFSGVYVKHTSVPPGGKLYVPNHSSWWDPLVIFFVNEALLQETAHGMMAEEGLKRYPFFRKIGAFPIGTKPKSQLNALKTAVNLLQDGRSVWLFAQGRERHHSVRPLGFQSGVGYIGEALPDTAIVPVAITYTFRHERKPDVFIEIGVPLRPAGTRKQTTAQAERAVEAMLEDVEKQLQSEQLDGFSQLLEGRKTIDRRVERGGT